MALACIGRLDDVEVARSWPDHDPLPFAGWTLAGNVGYLQAQVDAHRCVYLASPITAATVRDARGQLTMFGRELGALVEVVTGGRLRATPHRVTNANRERARISIPVFVNPPLAAMIECTGFEPPRRLVQEQHPHIHRVLPENSGTRAPFSYGAAEWRRKGLNVWCAACCSPA